MPANRLSKAFLASVFLLFLSGGARAGDPASAAIDVSLVTPSDFAAIVVHPRRIARSPLVGEVLKSGIVADGIKKLGLDPSEVDEIVALTGLKSAQSGPPEVASVMLVRFTHKVAAKELLARFNQTFNPVVEPIKEVKVADRDCYELGSNKGGGIAFAAGPNTIVVASKNRIRRVLAGGEPKGPLLDRLKKAGAESDFLVVLAPEAIPDFDKMIEAAKRGAPALAVNYLEAARTVHCATAAFSLTGPALLRLTLDAENGEAASNVQDLLEQALRMAAAGLVVAKASMPKEEKANYELLLKFADQFIDGGKAAKSGNQVTLEFKRPEVLNRAAPSIVAGLARSITEARAAGRQVQQMNNLKQITLAMLNYEQDNGHFPPAVIAKDGKPLLSWRVALLPYLEQKELYDRFHLDEPWDSPHNLPLSKTAASVYQSPDGPADGKTRVMVFTGKGAAFDGEKKFAAPHIRDGMSHTLFCVEAGPDKAVPWSKPEDLPFDPEKPLAALGKVPSKEFLAAMFDGSVHRLKVDNATLKALVTPDGGEEVNMDKLYNLTK